MTNKHEIDWPEVKARFLFQAKECFMMFVSLVLFLLFVSLIAYPISIVHKADLEYESEKMYQEKLDRERLENIETMLKGAENER